MTLEEIYGNAKALVEDKTYQIGEISEKTGLQKTANGWVKPKSNKKESVKSEQINKTWSQSDVVKSVPNGWKKDDGVTTVPNGYVAITNGKSRFGEGGRETKIIKEEYFKKADNKTTKAKKENIEKLKTKRTELDNQINKIGKENEKIFDENNGFREGTDSAGYKKWNENKQKIRELQKQKDDITDKIVKTKSEENISKRKVNGYGEATSREITTGTYERAQKRTKKDVENFLKRTTDSACRLTADTKIKLKK